jgi:hypothetical protein
LAKGLTDSVPPTAESGVQRRWSPAAAATLPPGGEVAAGGAGAAEAREAEGDGEAAAEDEDGGLLQRHGDVADVVLLGEAAVLEDLGRLDVDGVAADDGVDEGDHWRGEERARAGRDRVHGEPGVVEDDAGGGGGCALDAAADGDAEEQGVGELVVVEGPLGHFLL